MARAHARAQQKSVREVAVPAPVGGLNTVASGMDMPAGDLVLGWNVNAGEYGLRSRLGWSEWCTGLDGQDVRSILPFTGSTKDGSTSKLFAATEVGIFDCTTSQDSPSQPVTFGTQNTESGYAEYAAFTDLNAGHWLLVTDEENGYYTYSESGASWTKVTQGADPATQINGVDPAKFVQVLVHQNRAWFVEKDTQRAWYTALNSLYGTVTAFNFGTHFPHGGDLRCLATWSVDGGSGPESRLVAISGGGDVVIYEGIDPSSADTWRIVNQWYIGAVPVGRRLTTTMGGDVAIMSSVGILPVSKLVVGSPVIDRSQYATVKISNLFNQLQAATSTLKGWCMRLHPQDAALMVLVPTAVNQSSQQLVMSMANRSWYRYRDMPIGVCAEAWGGTLYFGTPDGRVCKNDGYLDGVTLVDPNSYRAISCSILTAFSNLGAPVFKRLQYIRPKVLSTGGAVRMNAEARYSFDFTEPSPPSTATSTGGSLWDVGLWDTAVWGGSYTPQVQVFGAFGTGVEAAIAFRMTVSARATLVGFDVGYDVGGAL